MMNVKITQKRSLIGISKTQKSTMSALGLRKVNKTVELKATPQIIGMIKKVNHLIAIENI